MNKKDDTHTYIASLVEVTAAEHVIVILFV